MDTREEAEWILDKLEQRLREELQGVVREEAGQGGLGEVKEEERRNEEKAPRPYPISYMRSNS